MGEYENVLQNQPVDVSEEWVGGKVEGFDPSSASGRVLSSIQV